MVTIFLDHFLTIIHFTKRIKTKSLNQNDKEICQRCQKSLIFFARKGLLKLIGILYPIIKETPIAKRE